MDVKSGQEVRASLEKVAKKASPTKGIGTVKGCRAPAKSGGGWGEERKKVLPQGKGSVNVPRRVKFRGCDGKEGAVLAQEGRCGRRRKRPAGTPASEGPCKPWEGLPAWRPGTSKRAPRPPTQPRSRWSQRDPRNSGSEPRCKARCDFKDLLSAQVLAIPRHAVRGREAHSRCSINA